MHTRLFSGALPQPATDKGLKGAEEDRPGPKGPPVITNFCTMHQAMNNRWPGAMIIAALGSLLFVAPPRCEAQNLVPNPGFEEREGDCDSLVCCFNVGSRPLNWFSWMNSPEYFNACNPGIGSDSLVAVPQNGWTYQYPWEGDAYVGAYCYDGVKGDYREYVGAQLIAPLIPGCVYRLRMRINVAYGGNYWLQNAGTACDNIGLLLTTSSNAWPGITGAPFAYRDYVHLRTVDPVADTAAWTLVEGTITADSAYAFVVLGNFYPDSLTTAVPIGEPDPWTGVTYYLFDGIEVVPMDPQCHASGLGEEEMALPQVLEFDGNMDVRWMGRLFQACVVDAVGRVVAQGSGNGASGWTLDAELPTGAYVVRLWSDGVVRCMKFVRP